LGAISLTETLKYLTTPRFRYTNEDNCGH
jgi:hypothetical protein